MTEFSRLERVERRSWLWCLGFCGAIFVALGLIHVVPEVVTWARHTMLAITLTCVFAALAAFYVAMTASIVLGKRDRARK